MNIKDLTLEDLQNPNLKVEGICECGRHAELVPQKLTTDPDAWICKQCDAEAALEDEGFYDDLD